MNSEQERQARGAFVEWWKSKNCGDVTSAEAYLAAHARQQAVIDAMDQRIADLERQLAASEKDAARYRWLRDGSKCDIRSLLCMGDFTSMDAFIDAALKETP